MLQKKPSVPSSPRRDNRSPIIDHVCNIMILYLERHIAT